MRNRADREFDDALPIIAIPTTSLQIIFAINREYVAFWLTFLVQIILIAVAYWRLKR